MSTLKVWSENPKMKVTLHYYITPLFCSIKKGRALLGWEMPDLRCAGAGAVLYLCVKSWLMIMMCVTHGDCC